MSDLHLSAGTVAARLLVAAASGLAVGLERETDGHEAGARTHLLLALGSALFGVLSVGAFADLTGSKNITVDASRIASYVPAGVGFLGAGTILKKSDRVHGLTTAASVWVVAATGLAAGLGMWSATVVGTLIAVAALVADRPIHGLSRRLRGGAEERRP
jgi:putative Mg2+ transporter-C (MgtC) family protein